MSCFLYDWRVSIFGCIAEFDNYPTFYIDGIINIKRKIKKDDDLHIPEKSKHSIQFGSRFS